MKRSFRPARAPRMLVTAATLFVAVAPPLSAQTRPVANSEAAFDPITHEGYIAPPEAIRRLVDAPRNLNVSYTAGNASPGARRYLMRTVSENMPSLAMLGAPHYNLAGWQIDHRGNRARAMTTRSLNGIELFDWASNRTIRVQLPANARAFGPQWSPDGNTIAYFALLDDATHIYLADAASGRSRQLTRTSVLATNVTSLYWTGDGRSIVTVLVPDARGAEPQPPRLATEPLVRVNENSRLRTRTLPDLIESPFEKELLEYHMTGQLAVIDVASRNVKKVGAPGMIRSINASPDAMHFRATYLDKPFSYFQQVGSWGTHELLVDASGKVIRELARRPLRDGTQDDPDPDPTDPRDPTDPDPDPGPGPTGRGTGGTQQAQRAANQPPPPDTSRRSLTWHPYDGGQVFLQLSRAATDSSAYVDRLVHLPNPADTTATATVYETTNRIQAVRFSDNGRILFVTEATAAAAAQGRGGAPAGGAPAGRGGAQGAAQNARTSTYEIAVFLDEGGQKYTISTRNGAANTAGPGGGGFGGGPGGGGRGGAGGGVAAAIGGAGGSFVTKTGRRGSAVVMISSDGRYVFAQGSARLDAPEDTTLNRPWIEKVEIKTGNRERIYHSNSPIAETIVAPLDDDFNRALIRRESNEVVGQQYILDLHTRQAKQITDNRDYFPEIAKAQRRTLQARRADGLPIRVRVTLPPDYQEGTRLPALFWFYPSEYDSASAYTRSLNTPNRGGGGGGPGGGNSYPSYGPRTMAFVTAAGYAFIEPDAPIVATDGRLPNDNYIRDLRENLQAVITLLDTLRIVDRNRLAIGGHSYGGFSTVNAMVHTSFFKAGIAGDGNYNRTLTPNGFQRERRDLWQGRDTYLAMSPFLYADQLSGALLMYHSMEDQNVGTDPINAPKLFHALQGLGKTVSLYMYPYEDHGPIARETMLDQWARWIAWLDKYVKNQGTEKPIISDSPQGGSH